jgi:hypothetical protein
MRGSARKGIGCLNESTLHADLIENYRIAGDQLEVPFGGYFVDIVRQDVLIEIQTAHFNSIRDKLGALLKISDVRLVYPIPALKWIVTNDLDSRVIRRRRSPRRGAILDLFKELVCMPWIVSNEHFSMEILFIEMEEIRCNDGKGSWRRGGVSILDRRLVAIQDRLRLTCPGDYLALLPSNLPAPFSSKDLATLAGICANHARKMIYVLHHSGAISMTGKIKNLPYYRMD